MPDGLRVQAKIDSCKANRDENEGLGEIAVKARAGEADNEHRGYEGETSSHKFGNELGEGVTDNAFVHIASISVDRLVSESAGRFAGVPDDSEIQKQNK